MAGEKKGNLEAAKAAELKLRQSVDAMLRSDEGQTVFKYLFGICGWNQADVPVDRLGHVNTDELQHNATRRAIYGKLRAKASRSLLTSVEEAAEMLYEQKAEEEGTSQQEKP